MDMNSRRQADFSVLMSLYIGEKAEYFEACMQSLMAQTVLPGEILIVLDGPVSPELSACLDGWRERCPELIRITGYEKNRGLGYALSVGVENCRYDLIARMDTDDIAAPERFEKQLAEFERDPGLQICGSCIDEFEETPSKVVAVRSVPLDEAGIRAYQRRRDAFNHMTVMYRRQAVLAAGNYQPCPLMEDTYLWVRMLAMRVKCKNLPDCLVHARIGRGMYRRRGGLRYFMTYRAGRRRVLSTGYISYWDYLVTLAVQFVVCIMPGGLRGWVFKHLLHR